LCQEQEEKEGDFVPVTFFGPQKNRCKQKSSMGLGKKSAKGEKVAPIDVPVTFPVGELSPRVRFSNPHFPCSTPIPTIIPARGKRDMECRASFSGSQGGRRP
jgi:hypothetical protein